MIRRIQRGNNMLLNQKAQEEILKYQKIEIDMMKKTYDVFLKVCNLWDKKAITVEELEVEISFPIERYKYKEAQIRKLIKATYGHSTIANIENVALICFEDDTQFLSLEYFIEFCLCCGAEFSLRSINEGEEIVVRAQKEKNYQKGDNYE